MFEFLCIISSLSHTLEVMKNTTYIEKSPEFEKLSSLSQQRYFTLYNEKTSFALKKGVFHWASKSAISIEKGVHFSSGILEKGVFFKLGYEHGIRFGRNGRPV